MAVYNGMPFLRTALDSILGQTFRDFELLIIDDGSTDDSRQLVMSYDDQRIRLIVNESNRGLTPSLNLALQHARGVYVARHDADDISEPHRLARQVAYLQNNPEIALLGTSYTKIDEHGNELGRRHMPVDSTRIQWCLLFFCPFAHTSVMFRRALVLDRVGTYDESYKYAQDYDLWSRIAAVLPSANLRYPAVRVRITSASMTATHENRLIEGPSISTRNLAPLLHWTEATAEQNLADYFLMHRLLYGNHRDMRPVDVLRATHHILELVPAFCDHHMMSVRERELLRSAVGARLRWRLMMIVSRWSNEEYAAMSDLLVGSTHRRWLTLLGLPGARRAFVKLRGPEALSALEPWRSL